MVIMVIMARYGSFWLIPCFSITAQDIITLCVSKIRNMKDIKFTFPRSTVWINKSIMKSLTIYNFLKNGVKNKIFMPSFREWLRFSQNKIITSGSTWLDHFIFARLPQSFRKTHTHTHTTYNTKISPAALDLGNTNLASSHFNKWVKLLGIRVEKWWCVMILIRICYSSCYRNKLQQPSVAVSVEFSATFAICFDFCTTPLACCKIKSFQETRIKTTFIVTFRRNVYDYLWKCVDDLVHFNSFFMNIQPCYYLVISFSHSQRHLNANTK